MLKQKKVTLVLRRINEKKIDTKPQEEMKERKQEEEEEKKKKKNGEREEEEKEKVPYRRAPISALFPPS